MNLRHLIALTVCALAVASAPAAAPPVAMLDTASDPASPLPQRLRDTGLFGDDGTTVRADIVAFAPQYPLWSDGATKRRWIHLPAGHVDRRVATRRLGVPARHAAVEGVQPGPPRRDAPHRAPCRRDVALHGLRVECRGHRCRARSGGRHRHRCRRCARRTLFDPLAQRLPRVPRRSERAGAGILRAAAFAGSRSACAARGTGKRRSRRPADAGRARDRAQPASIAARRAAAHCRRQSDRARRTRLSARATAATATTTTAH